MRWREAASACARSSASQPPRRRERRRRQRCRLRRPWSSCTTSRSSTTTSRRSTTTSCDAADRAPGPHTVRRSRSSPETRCSPRRCDSRSRISRPQSRELVRATLGMIGGQYLDVPARRPTCLAAPAQDQLPLLRRGCVHAMGRRVRSGSRRLGGRLPTDRAALDRRHPRRGQLPDRARARGRGRLPTSSRTGTGPARRDTGRHLCPGGDRRRPRCAHLLDP